MSRKRRSRIYVRNQGGTHRYYGDFRDFHDVGGGREALRPGGAGLATSDERLAQLLAAKRVTELEGYRRRRACGEPLRETMLTEYITHHLHLKLRSQSVSPAWQAAAALHLDMAAMYFCLAGRDVSRDASGALRIPHSKDRPLSSITVSEIQEYVSWLASRSNGRSGRLSPSSQRKYLNSLSNLFRRALSEGRLTNGINPVSVLMEKPVEGQGRAEAPWLEVPEAARVLHCARRYQPARTGGIDSQTLYALVGTMLLTGGRPSEVLGLEHRDISLERGTVTFRPNESRQRLKNQGSYRTVRIWPQLAEILVEYLASRHIIGRMVFPSTRGDGRIVDMRKALDSVAANAQLGLRKLRPYAFRHTYCAARLQTLDNGAPVSPFTVGKELGHSGMALVNRVYGHLGEVRQRSNVVEYRHTES